MPAVICVRSDHNGIAIIDNVRRDCNGIAIIDINAPRCESPTSSAVEFIDIPHTCEPHSIFEHDNIELSTVHTYVDDTI